MSVTDQAFIRAYQVDVTSKGAAPAGSIQVGLGSVILAPHAKFAAARGFQPRAPHSAEPAAALATVNSLQTEAVFSAENSATSTTASAASHHFALGRAAKSSLSSFVEKRIIAPQIGDGLKAALEVDAFRWPSNCELLLSEHAACFDELVAELRHEVKSGHKVTAISGLNRGEGRTTLSLCLARRLASSGMKVALIDADFAKPQLAQNLGLAIVRGWEAVLAGEEALAEVMIESLADRFSLAPLAAHQHDEVPLSIFRIATTLAELADNFDIVLVDAGPLSDDASTPKWLLESDIGVHAVVLAHNVLSSSARQLAAACLQMAEAGVRQLGIVETFVEERKP